MAKENSCSKNNVATWDILRGLDWFNRVKFENIGNI